MSSTQQVQQQTSGLGEVEVCTTTDPIEVAEAAGLHYVIDTVPGIQRKRAGKYFSYLDPKGKVIRNPDELQRIRSLG